MRGRVRHERRLVKLGARHKEAGGNERVGSSQTNAGELIIVLSITILAPFVTVMSWAVIVAASAYPAFLWLATKLDGRDGLAATLLVIAYDLVIV